MEIYVYTPQGFETGGIELLHQLCSELSTYADINAYIWYRDMSKAYISDCYKKYGNIFKVTDLPPKGSVLIFPEAVATQLHNKQYEGYTKVLFWESVYWYEYWIPKSQYLRFPDGVIHIAQSYYACEWLKRETNIDAIMVTDYLNDEYMNADLSKPRKRQILYNPKKGLDITTRIITQMPNEKFIPILDMTVSQVKALMEESMLYIDFGNHPGKDRIPREAAMCGCCVITNRKGSADNLIDVPIPSDYKFHECFMNLAISQMKFVLDNYNGCKYDFDDYREIIKNEKGWFKKDVEKLVSKLGVTE